MSGQIVSSSARALRQRGVTLVELMTVVAVIAILATLGYPMYLEQQLKGRRADGKAMLNNVMVQLERFYTENNTFTNDLDELGFGAGTVASEHGSYTIALAAGPTGDIATSVTATATPVAADPKCGTLSLSSDQSRSASGTQPATCW